MKKVLVTGATSGFGKLLTESLLQKGHHVLATGRNICERQEIFSDLDSGLRTRLEFFDLDVTSVEQRKSLVERLHSMGGIDVLVNNAGVGHFGPLEEISDEHLENLFETNLLGMMKLTRDILPILRQQQNGRIINVSSAFGFMGFPLTSLYCATKFGVEGFSQALAYEMKPHGVDVLTVRPGGFRTKFLENAHMENTHSGAYSQQVQGMQAFHRQMSSRKNPPNPMAVVEQIVKMVEGKVNKSIVVGSDAKMSWLFKKVLPDAVYGSMMNKVSNRIFSQAKATHV